MSSGNGTPRNRLSESRSPYLLQHATNPVDWREWGEEAFAEARRRDAPIFLSIGYSTCHWCHVMARESFEDETMARRMNELFVNVKLDREERPDVDRIYMAFVQSVSGSGGWPMSVWLTPDLKPFYGGTYFPPEDRYGRVGFATLIERIGELWREERSTLLEYGEKSQAVLSENASGGLGGSLETASEAIDRCLAELEASYDSERGGFGGAPKFPMHGYHQLLIEGIARRGNARLNELLVGTLDKLRRGGIWDHLGGGFHRYSVDRYWHIPHYEKMLYDQGQLASAFAEGYRLTGRAAFREVAERIVDYVGRDLRGPRGELYAAEDADSPLPADPSKHGEGAFYTWTAAELAEALGEDAKLFGTAYAVEADGNARPESDPHGELKGVNTLMRVKTSAELAEGFGLSAEAVERRLARCRDALFERRAKRPRPHCDDKTLVSWSCLMISGACKTYQATGYGPALELAEQATRFLVETMWDAERGAFYRSFRGSPGGSLAFAEDYAAAANAFIDLYECGFEAEWLVWGKRCLAALSERYADTERGGYFATEAGDASVIARLRDDYDGAEPSANSMAAVALLKLAALLDDEDLRAEGRRVVEAFGEQWNRAPRALPVMLVGASRLLEADQQIVIVGRAGDEGRRELERTANRWRLPFSALCAIDAEAGLPEVLAGNEKLAAMAASVGVGPATAFVCEDFVCREPVSSAEALESLLR